MRVRAFLRFAAQAAVGGAFWWGGPCESRPALERRLVGRERLRPAAPAHSCRVLGPLDEQRPAGAPRRGLMLGRAWSRAGGSGAGAGLAWQSRRVTDPVNVQAVETAGASQGRPVSRGATGLHGVARKVSADERPAGAAAAPTPSPGGGRGAPSGHAAGSPAPRPQDRVPGSAAARADGTPKTGL